MNALKEGWFSELGTLWPGQALSLEVEKVVFEGKSSLQDIVVFDSKSHGRVLVLDGAIQVTEKDEYAYHEMITQIPLFAHPNPRKVLIVGGGDGGALREVVKHTCVEEVDLVDIDGTVIEVCKKYFPQTARGYDHPKVRVFVADGFEFMKSHENVFDVIISDSSDPVGPAASLFQGGFFELASRALRPGGILCVQCESFWLHLDIITATLDHLGKHFTTVDYAWTSIPTYPSGMIGFGLGMKGNGDLREAVRTWTDDDWQMAGFKYYTPEVHKASFVLPEFARKALFGHR